jgi:hypothetical protein
MGNYPREQLCGMERQLLFASDVSWDIAVFVIGSNPFRFLEYSGVCHINEHVGCHFWRTIMTMQ